MTTAIKVPASLFTINNRGAIEWGHELTYGAELHQLQQVPESSTLVTATQEETVAILSGLNIHEMSDICPGLQGVTSGQILSLKGVHIHKFHTPEFVNIVLRWIKSSYIIPASSLPYDPIKEVKKRFDAVSVNVNPNLASPTFGIDVEHLDLFNGVVKELEKKGITVESNKTDILTQKKAKQELLKSSFRTQAIKNWGRILIKVSYNSAKDSNAILTVVQHESEIDNEYLSPDSYSEFLWADQNELFKVLFSATK